MHVLPRYVWVACAAASVVAALLCWVPTEVPRRFAWVRIAWSGAATPEARDYVERKRRLRPLGDPSVSGTRYVLADTSVSNLSALAATPDLAVVEGLDPHTHQPTLWAQVPLVEWLDRVHGRDLRPWLKPFTTTIGAAWLAFVLALLARPAGRAWLVSRVPAVTPAVLAAYRLSLAAGLAVVVLLANLPSAWFTLACLVPAAAFAAGLWPRVSLGVFLALMAYALRMDFADHDYFAPVQVWLLLLFVPWGERGARWPRARGSADAAAQPSRRYGVALVVVPLVLGTAYFAAAFAKLDQSVRAWLLEGAVRYHIAQDGPAAPGNLWRMVASRDWLTVPIGPAVIVLEAIVIAAVLSVRPRVRLAAGVVAVLLHLGFGLLQGVWWEAWWVLLPAFLPWPQVVARFWPAAAPDAADPPGGGAVPRWAALALTLMLVQQPVVSLLRLERKPFVSNFPMYSNVQWSSKAEYAAHMDRWKKPAGRAVRLVAGSAEPSALQADLGTVRACGALLDRAAALADGRESGADDRAVFDVCAEAFRRTYGRPLTSLTVQASDRRFSWEAVDFVPTGDWVSVGTLGGWHTLRHRSF